MKIKYFIDKNKERPNNCFHIYKLQIEENKEDTGREVEAIYFNILNLNNFILEIHSDNNHCGFIYYSDFQEITVNDYFDYKTKILKFIKEFKPVTDFDDCNFYKDDDSLFQCYVYAVFKKSENKYKHIKQYFTVNLDGDLTDIVFRQFEKPKLFQIINFENYNKIKEIEFTAFLQTFVSQFNKFISNVFSSNLKAVSH